MQQIFKNFLISGVLLAFLVSAAGFRLVKHTCPMCDIAQYSLFNTSSCCHNNPSTHTSGPISCCSILTDHTGCSTTFASATCCQNESQLIVIEELVTPPTFRVEACWVSVLPEFFKPDLFSVSCQLLQQAYRHPPPPVFSGTDYIIYLQQLKIAHA